MDFNGASGLIFIAVTLVVVTALALAWLVSLSQLQSQISIMHHAKCLTHKAFLCSVVLAVFGVVLLATVF